MTAVRSWPLALAILAASTTHCGSSPSAAPGADAGVRPDAGRPEASTSPDGSTRDASPGDGGSLAPDAAPVDSGPLPPDPCIEAGTCPPGAWISVTPANVDLVDGACGNYGTESVQIDPMRPSDMYTQFNCQGIWKSTDYGLTWNGPINTGTGGAAVGGAAGGIAMAPHDTSSPPILYWGGIRGTAIGFWKSTDGGVSWTNYPIAAATPDRQDVYPPVVDPYDVNHLLITGHEQAVLGESVDGGMTWTAVMAPDPDAGSGEVFFIDTGVASTTRTTWLWINDIAGGGTLRTADGGATWTQVDANEHPHALSQIYQPDNTSGTVYMAGLYSENWWGVLRSQDYGQTWADVGLYDNETIVFGTPKNIYAMYGWAIGPGQMVDPSMQVGAQPGTGTWMKATTPAAMTQGPTQAAVTSDGTHSIIVTANFNGGLWRYVEP